MVASNTYGRQVIIPLTNKSGGGVIAGDVVVVDTTNNDAFTTTTSAGFTGMVGVAQETIANNATGRVLVSGYAALVNTNASVTRGDFGKTFTVAKQASDAGASRGTGTFCQFLTGGTTSDAVVFPVDLLGSSLTNPMTTKGDMIMGDTSGVPTRLAGSNTAFVLTSNGATSFPTWQARPEASSSDTFITANVTMTNADTFYDGPSASYVAGTWCFWWKLMTSPTTANTTSFTAKFWDGSTVYDISQEFHLGGNAGGMFTMAGFALVVLAATTTLKVSAACSRAASVIIADNDYQAVADKASHILAVRIA